MWMMRSTESTPLNTYKVELVLMPLIGSLSPALRVSYSKSALAVAFLYNEFQLENKKSTHSAPPTLTLVFL